MVFSMSSSYRVFEYGWLIARGCNPPAWEGLLRSWRVPGESRSLKAIRRWLTQAVLVFLLVAGCGSSITSVFAQELEVRRWNHLPIGRNFVAANYAHTDGEIEFNPVLLIEDVVMDVDTWLLGYVRAFELFDRTARVEVRQAWQEGTWSGLLDGTPTTISRSGWSDTFLRFAVNLFGAPPLVGKSYADYRARTEVETIVGMALGIQVPTGQYFDDKLINLGSNRFTFRPQLGIQHHNHNWTFEATGTFWIYTDNNSFFDGNKLEQDPYFTIDGSVEYKFDSGLWVSASGGIGVGGQSTVNGDKKDDYKEDFAWAVSMGFPLTRSLSVKATYLETGHWSQVGLESQTVSVGILTSW